MSSNNNNDDDIKDASLHGGGDGRSTPSQSNQQKDKEARRDAEDRLRNFNYAKSIGAEGKDGEEESGGVKPLSPLAQRYLGTLKVGSSSSSSGDGEQDGVGEDNDAAISPTTKVDNRERKKTIKDLLKRYGVEEAKPSIEQAVHDSSVEEKLDAATVEEEVDNTATATIVASQPVDNEEEEDDEDENNGTIVGVMGAAAAVAVGSAISESNIISSPPNEGDDNATTGNDSIACKSISQNESVQDDDGNVDDIDNASMSITCIDGEEEEEEDEEEEKEEEDTQQQEDETQYCGTVPGTIATGARSRVTSQSSEQSDNAIVDEESQVTYYTANDDDGVAQKDPPAAQILERQSQSTPSEEEEADVDSQPSRRLWRWLLPLIALLVVVVVIAGMGVGVDRGLNNVDKASIFIPLPTQSPTSFPSLSFAPSDRPSSIPSSNPSDIPSSSPSLSAAPSSEPTFTSPPSISSEPTSQPSDQPTLSNQPSSEVSTEESSMQFVCKDFMAHSPQFYLFSLLHRPQFRQRRLQIPVRFHRQLRLVLHPHLRQQSQARLRLRHQQVSHLGSHLCHPHLLVNRLSSRPFRQSHHQCPPLKSNHSVPFSREV